MNKLWNWIKTNKTTLAGIFTLIYTPVMPYLVSKGYISVELAGIITGILMGGGLLAAKDSNKHSTNEQVTKATIKKRKLESEKQE